MPLAFFIYRLKSLMTIFIKESIAVIVPFARASRVFGRVIKVYTSHAILDK